MTRAHLKRIHHVVLTVVACLALVLGGAAATVASLLAPSEEVTTGQRTEERSERAEGAPVTLHLSTSARRQRQKAARRCVRHVEPGAPRARPTSPPEASPPVDAWTRPRRC